MRIIFILFKSNKKVNVDKVIKNERIHCFFPGTNYGSVILNPCKCTHFAVTFYMVIPDGLFFYQKSQVLSSFLAFLAYT